MVLLSNHINVEETRTSRMEPEFHWYKRTLINSDEIHSPTLFIVRTGMRWIALRLLVSKVDGLSARIKCSQTISGLVAGPRLTAHRMKLKKNNYIESIVEWLFRKKWTTCRRICISSWVHILWRILIVRCASEIFWSRYFMAKALFSTLTIESNDFHVMNSYTSPLNYDGVIKKSCVRLNLLHTHLEMAKSSLVANRTKNESRRII